MQQDNNYVALLRNKTQDGNIDCKSILSAAKNLLDNEQNAVANCANIAALLFNSTPNVNWCGFYFSDANQELVLGPFQGLPACVRIPLGKGVCGTAALTQKAINVHNVHEFPGHIACDAASRSELVIPLIWKGKCIGVLDIDSPVESRFDSEDEIFFSAICDIVLQYSDFSFVDSSN